MVAVAYLIGSLISVLVVMNHAVRLVSIGARARSDRPKIVDKLKRHDLQLESLRSIVLPRFTGFRIGSRWLRIVQMRYVATVRTSSGEQKRAWIATGYPLWTLQLEIQVMVSTFTVSD